MVLTYPEFPIRCKTCNGVIASKVKQLYELLNSNFSMEEAFEAISLPRYCCRAAITNPTILFPPMANRKVIEGYIKPDQLDTDQSIKVAQGLPSFTTCSEINQFKPDGVAITQQSKEMSGLTTAEFLKATQRRAAQGSSSAPQPLFDRAQLDSVAAQKELADKKEHLKMLEEISKKIPEQVDQEGKVMTDIIVEPSYVGIPTVKFDDVGEPQLHYAGYGLRLKGVASASYACL